MKSARSIVLLAMVALLLFCASPSRADTIAQWEYETSGGTPVTVGQPADGQLVDETGGHASGPFNGTGYGDTLIYQPGVFASSHSLQFTEGPSPYDSVELDLPDAVGGITEGAFTIETWFKTTDTGRGVPVGTYNGDLTDDLNFEIHSGRIRGHIGSPTAITDFYSSGHASVADGQWHHGAFVRDSAGGAVRLYLDGVQRGATTDKSGAFTLTAPTLYLGRDYRTDSTHFDGSLDTTRISNTALTPEQFLISGAGEQNYYRMETDGGSPVATGQTASVVDDTGAHPFTYNGAAKPASPTYSSDMPGIEIVRDGVKTPNRFSLSFDGAGDYVELGDKPLLTTLTQDDFTIEFFLKTPPRDDRAVIVGTYDGSTAYIMNLEIGGSTHGGNQGHLRPFFDSSGSYDDFWGDTDISDDEWHHVALIRSGAGTGGDMVQLYVDYGLDGQMALNTGQYTLRPSFFRLGGDSRGSGYYYEGLLDEFRITRGALGVDEFLVAVPEPASLSLLGLGLLALARRRRRR